MTDKAAAALQKELKDAKVQLARAQEERDRLQREVDNLSGGDSMFSGSYMLSEQINALHKEVKDLKAQLTTAKREKDTALQDLSAAKAAQQALDSQLTAVRQELAGVSGERDFYQAAAARSVSDVEAHREEVAQLKARLAECEVQLGRAEAQASGELRARKEAEASLAQRHQQLVQLRSELEAKKTEHASAARQLTSQREVNRKLEATSGSLQAKLDVAGEDLERTRQQLHQFRESESRLRVQWQEAQALAAQLQGTSKGQAEQLASLDGQLAELRKYSAERIQQLSSSEATLQQQLTAAQEQVTELQQEVRAVRQELQAAEQRLQEQRHAEHAQRTGAVAFDIPAAPMTVSAFQASASPNSATGGELQSVETDTDLAAAHGAREPEQVEGGASLARVASGASGLVSTVSVGAIIDAADDAEQLTILRTMVHDLKVKLAQATQEKVEALLTAAELKQALAAAKVQGGKPTPGPSHAHTHTHSLPPLSPHATPVGSGGSGTQLLSSSPGGTTGGLAAYMSSRLAGGISSLRGTGWLPAFGSASAPSVAPAETSTTPRNTPRSLHRTSSGTDHSGDRSPSATVHGAREPLKETSSVTAAPAGSAPAAVGTSTSLPSTISTSLSSPVGLSPRAAGTPADTSQQQAAALLACVQQLVMEASEYLASLKSAARVILAAHTDPAMKWSALTGLSQLHVQLNRTRARMGLTRQGGVLDEGPKEPVSSGMTKSGRLDQPELCTRITGQVLELVDVGLACLEAYNRQEALTSVMAQG